MHKILKNHNSIFINEKRKDIFLMNLKNKSSHFSNVLKLINVSVF